MEKEAGSEKWKIHLNPDEVIRLWHELHNQTEVARHLGSSQAAVGRVLRKNGIHAGAGKWQRHMDPDEVIHLWHELHNQAEIARRLGFSRIAVNKILRKNGIHVGRGAKKQLCQFPMLEIIARYNAGETSSEIGKAYGVQGSSIRKRLHQAGIVLRKRGTSGPKNPQYKHGRKYNPMHFYRRQSYEVAAICLGQPLEQGWVIHHLDENPHNNQPDNLIVFPSQSLHFRFHQWLLKTRVGLTSKEAIQKALAFGGLRLPPPPNPIRFAPYKGQPDPSGSPPSPSLDQTESVLDPDYFYPQSELPQ